MRQYKLSFALLFFWFPLVVCAFLNPGRNGEYAATFTVPKLVALGLCGLLWIGYFVANLGPGKLQSLACTKSEATWPTVGWAWFALAGGLMNLWWSTVNLIKL
jgi:hypothetical protein